MCVRRRSGPSPCCVFVCGVCGVCDLIQNRLLLRPDTVDGWGTTNTLGLRTRAKQCTTWRTPLGRPLLSRALGASRAARVMAIASPPPGPLPPSRPLRAASTRPGLAKSTGWPAKPRPRRPGVIERLAAPLARVRLLSRSARRRRVRRQQLRPGAQRRCQRRCTRIAGQGGVGYVPAGLVCNRRLLSFGPNLPPLRCARGTASAALRWC